MTGLVPIVRRLAPLLVLVIAAIAISVIVRHEVYPSYSWNRDEPVYLWQTETMKNGQLVSTDGGQPEFLQPWLTGVRDGSFFSQYTIGWPVALTAADVLLGSAGVALALAAALAVVGVYALAIEVTRDRAISLVAAAAMTLSPILAVQSGQYLAYLFSLGLGLLFGAALLAGFRRQTPWLVVVAGVLLGLVFLTRPFDAVLWAAPFVAYVAFVHRREWDRLWRGALWLALGVAPLFLIGLLYNAHVTGSATEFPITAADPLDTFGFGIRRIMPLWTPVDYTVLRAFRGAGRNLFYLPGFMVGSFLGLIAAAIGLWLRRRDRTTAVLLLLCASFPVGYFFFWGIYLSGSKVTLSGPLYYIPLYGPLCIFAATALVAAWRRRVALGVGAAVLIVVASGVATYDKLDRNHTISETQTPWRESVQGLHEPSLVVVDRSGPYLLQLNPFSANTPAIDGRIVYAVDRGPATLDLIASRPTRTPYLQRTDRTPRDALSDPTVPTVTLERIRVVTGSVITIDATVTNPSDAPVVVAYLQAGQQRVEKVVATDGRRGDTYDVSWTVGTDGAGTDFVLGSERLDTLAVGVGSGDSQSAAFQGRRTEARLGYRIEDGTIEVMTPADVVRLTVRDGRLREHQVRTGVEVRVSGG